MNEIGEMLHPKPCNFSYLKLMISYCEKMTAVIVPPDLKIDCIKKRHKQGQPACVA
jgi:hypothetical protein